jgi:hypothetical protein
MEVFEYVQCKNTSDTINKNTSVYMYHPIQKSAKESEGKHS